MSFCALCLLLLLGKVLRSTIPLLQKIYLPSSVVGGLLGLLVLSSCDGFFPSGMLCEWTAGWSAIPGFLINIVFASLFLGTKIPNIKKIWSLSSTQFCYGQINAWGQYVVGLAVAGLCLVPFFGVNPGFGTLLEMGFQGGHGTVGGMTATFEQLGWREGSALGYTVATFGMIVGVVIGMVLVNIAIARGWVKTVRPSVEKDALKTRGLYRLREQPSAGKQTVYSDSIDSLAFHIAVIGIAVFLGYVFKQGLLSLNTVMPLCVRRLHVLESFPLFPLCMIGGLLVQIFLRKMRLSVLVNGVQIQRLGGAALDFLVVAAVASIQIKFIAQNWLPLLILVVSGIFWNLWTTLYLAPRMFKEDWFERAIAEFGQASGVTATGLLLLRTVDPDAKTSATKAFGYKQLLHEPIMGGGIWTSVALPLVLSQGNLVVWLISLAATLIFLSIWFFIFRRKG